MKYIIKNLNEFSIKEINDFAKQIKNPKAKKLSKMHPHYFKQSVVGEILLSLLLNSENINYDNIIIKENANGKPVIVNNNIYFSISHSKNMVMCAIDYNPIGVDILQKEKININIKKIFCTPKEIKYITNTNKFYEVFTLKEAIIKAKGLSINNILEISIDYNNFSFDGGYCYQYISTKDYIACIYYKK